MRQAVLASDDHDPLARVHETLLVVAEHLALVAQVPGRPPAHPVDVVKPELGDAVERRITRAGAQLYGVLLGVVGDRVGDVDWDRPCEQRCVLALVVGEELLEGEVRTSLDQRDELDHEQETTGRLLMPPPAPCCADAPPAASPLRRTAGATSPSAPPTCCRAPAAPRTARG